MIHILKLIVISTFLTVFKTYIIYTAAIVNKFVK